MSDVDDLVERVAAACCNDILARDVADKQCTPAFEDCDDETQTFWRHIARAALSQTRLSLPRPTVERLEAQVRANALKAAFLAVQGIESPFDHHRQTPENCAFNDALDAAEQAIAALSAQTPKAAEAEAPAATESE